MTTIKTDSKIETECGILRWAGKITIALVIYGVVLFISSGSLDWPKGWAYLGVVFLTQVLTALVLIPKRPDLVNERSKLQKGTKGWDRFLAPAVAILGPLAMIATAGLDFRNGWSVPVNAQLWIVGLVLAFGSGIFILWAMVANPFFAATVRIQGDRGQTVIDNGPYRLVRHPGYLGSVLFDLATPLALGSWWAFVPAFITIILLIIRTSLEDRTLRAELEGYRKYTTVTRYRLIPGIW